MTSFEEGIALFNDGQFWEAHERWEDCWRGSREPDATLYKGLIQTAAALVHWQRGNDRGLHRNWYKARPKLVALPSTMRDLAIDRLLAEMDGFVTRSPHDSAPRIEYAAGHVPPS